MLIWHGRGRLSSGFRSLIVVVVVIVDGVELDARRSRRNGGRELVGGGRGGDLSEGEVGRSRSTAGDTATSDRELTARGHGQRRARRRNIVKSHSNAASGRETNRRLLLGRELRLLLL